MAVFEVTPEEAWERYRRGEVVLLDVRTPREWAAARVPGAVHIPLDELPARWQELDPEAETLVLCAHGIRSLAAGAWLAQLGFERVASVRHGLSAWPGPIEAGGRAATPGPERAPLSRARPDTAPPEPEC